MIPVLRTNPLRFSAAALSAGTALTLLAGCGERDEIRVYDAVRDQSAPVVTASASNPAKQNEPIAYTVPAGWKSLPGQSMRYATFAVSPEHPDVVLTVIPLPTQPNELLPNVNRWEEQVGLPPSSQDALTKLVTHVEIPPDASADIVDLNGKDPKTGNPTRMLAALVPHDGQTWFFKLVGPSEVVGAQKDNFNAFIRSIRFHHDDHTGHAHGPAPAATPAATSSPVMTDIAWDKLPAGWRETKSEQAIRAKTFVIESDGQQAELAVTRLRQAQAGDFLANVNRWRTSIGLEPVADPAAHPPRKATVAGGEGFIVDVPGPDKRVLVGMTGGSGDDLWFFKLTGPKPLVDAQQPSFEAFLKTLRFVGDDR